MFARGRFLDGVDNAGVRRMAAPAEILSNQHKLCGEPGGKSHSRSSCRMRSQCRTPRPTQLSGRRVPVPPFGTSATVPSAAAHHSRAAGAPSPRSARSPRGRQYRRVRVCELAQLQTLFPQSNLQFVAGVVAYFRSRGLSAWAEFRAGNRKAQILQQEQTSGCNPHFREPHGSRHLRAASCPQGLAKGNLACDNVQGPATLQRLQEETPRPGSSSAGDGPSEACQPPFRPALGVASYSPEPLCSSCGRRPCLQAFA